ncbi:hypothetical protein HYW53_02670 [Candidatus Giovannonibacteria bacterium]|nr:hypothetical protein [Candidatus Giovannonibacteria bacterium]
MLFTWSQKRQLVFFSALLLILILIAVALIYRFTPAPSCKDGKLNQDEEEIDCGGLCSPCQSKIKEIVEHWTRFFPLSSGHYEAASLVENPNTTLGTSFLSYTIFFYDAKGILIAEKTGRTFLNPGEKTLIYEKDIPTFERTPARAEIQLTPERWKKIERQRPQILVTKRDFENDPFGRLNVTLTNQALFPIENLFLSAVLFDASGNAIGVSTTRLERIEGESDRDVFFTWRSPFLPIPSRIEILIRADLTK